MRKLYLIIAVICAFMSSQKTVAQTAAVNGLTYEVTSEENKTCKLMKVDEGLTDVVIPSEVQIGDNKYQVTSMSTSFPETVLYITIPDCMDNVDPFFLSSYRQIRRFNVAEGNQAYKSVDGVLYNHDMTTLLRVPISWNHGTEKVDFEIPASVKSVNMHAMRSCVNIGRIIIPEGVETLGTSCFGGMEQLESVNIPNSVVSMASTYSVWQGVFGYCIELRSVTIGSGLKEIPGCCFGLCGKLTDIKIGENVTSIGSQAFSGCSALAEITLPEKVTSISGEGYSSAFSDCTSLKKVRCLSSNPATILNGQAFPAQTLESGELLVPEEALQAYKDAEYWKDFININTFASVDNISSDIASPKVTYTDGAFRFSGITSGIAVEVYTPSGVLVASGKIMNDTFVFTGNGIYIVKAGETAKTVIVR